MEMTFHGSGLERPECVLAHESGLLIAPCWKDNGGISLVTSRGTAHHLAADPPKPLRPPGLRPNGVALEDGGTVLLAHLGAETGAICRLHPDGGVETVCDTVEGRPMPPANFVTLDRQGRIWFTVSTRVIPRADDYRATAHTGFIAVIEGGVARIVADGLGYTNEIVLSPDERQLWVNETFARRTSVFDLAPDTALSNKRTVAEYGMGTFPDGLALDEEGGLWATSIVSNRVIRIATDGSMQTVLEDSVPEHLETVEDAFREGTMGRPHLDRAESRQLKNISNLAFGGPDRRTAYLGCLLGDSIASFPAPVAGVAPIHWTASLGPLARHLP